MLSACISLDSSGRGEARDDFVAFGAEVMSAASAGRQEIYDEALAAHQSLPSAGTALRLAIVSLGMEADLLTDARTLLEYAASSATTDEQRQLAAFLDPFVERLIDQQSTIDSEIAARESLEEQLEALKALEEQLNAGADRR